MNGVFLRKNYVVILLRYLTMVGWGRSAFWMIYLVSDEIWALSLQDLSAVLGGSGERLTS
jgi:hypothetical protein